MLVCMKSKECYYIGQASKRSQPRLLPKVKGQSIESVAWNKMETRDQNGGTGPILLGTAQGKSLACHTMVLANVLTQALSTRLMFSLRTVY